MQIIIYIAIDCNEFCLVSFRGGGVNRNPADIKDMLLRWCRAKTRGYEVIK